MTFTRIVKVLPSRPVALRRCIEGWESFIFYEYCQKLLKQRHTLTTGVTQICVDTNQCVTIRYLLFVNLFTFQLCHRKTFSVWKWERGKIKSHSCWFTSKLSPHLVNPDSFFFSRSHSKEQTRLRQPTYFCVIFLAIVPSVYTFSYS